MQPKAIAPELTITTLSDDYTAISIYTKRMADLLDYLMSENKKLKDKNQKVVIVSSGAIALGCKKIGRAHV